MKRIKWIFSKACNNNEWYVFCKSFEYRNEVAVMIDITALGRLAYMFWDAVSIDAQAIV